MKPKSLIFGVYVASMIFVAGIALGFLTSVSDPNYAREQLNQAFESLGFLERFGNWGIFLFIFFNNLIKALLAMLLGIFFGVAPMFFLLMNGQAVGMVTGLAFMEGSMDILVAGVLPHGVLEIPAILLASGYGIWFGWRVFAKLSYGHTLRGMFTYAFRGFVRLVFPMILTAAVIETFLTPLAIDWINR